MIFVYRTYQQVSKQVSKLASALGSVAPLLLTATLSFADPQAASSPPAVAPPHQIFEQITGTPAEADRTRWDALYSTNVYVYGREPAEFIKRHIAVLPVGKALDIAMGEGRNAVFLAKKGFQVVGVDYSEVALRKARRLAKDHRVSIRTENADLNHYKIRAGEYDVIININYLMRPLYPQIKRGLKPGGVVVFENWTMEQLKNPTGQSVLKDFLLEPGELKRVFEDFEILVYQESNDGKNAKASLIARKPLKP